MKKIKSTYLLLIAILAVAFILVGCEQQTLGGVGPSGGPAAVDLGTASTFAILAKSAVTTTGSTVITGDVGISPNGSSSLTGFALDLPAGGYRATSTYVKDGFVYASDYAPPTPGALTLAVIAMEAAYVDAAGRPLPDKTELGAGEIGGLTIEPGLYKWSTGVSISKDVTLFGSDSAVWIFQIAQGLTIANGKKVLLSGGAQAKNIFWQVGSAATLGTTASVEGNIMTLAGITLGTGAKLHGTALAQTAVTLNANVVTEP